MSTSNIQRRVEKLEGGVPKTDRVDRIEILGMQAGGVVGRLSVATFEDGRWSRFRCHL